MLSVKLNNRKVYTFATPKTEKTTSYDVALINI